MMPGYSKFTKAIALKGIVRPIDVPSVQLGVGKDETMESIQHGRAVRTQPGVSNYGNAETGGIVAGQSTFGVAGFGNLIPMVAPGDIPYYGPITGGE